MNSIRTDRTNVDAEVLEAVRSLLRIDRDVVMGAATWDDWIGRLRRLPDDAMIGPSVTARRAREQAEARLPLLVPPAAPPGYTWHRGVPYGTAGTGGRTMTLHLYRPVRAASLPGVVFVHGGGFSAGHPYMLARHARALAEAGCVTATIHYRLSTEAPWPACLEDTKCAVRWMRANATELRIDPERIAVVGGSAGGYLAAMTALAPGRWEGDGGWADASSEVQCAVLYNPVLELGAGQRGEERMSLFGSSDELAAADPFSHVGSGTPPVAIRVGSDDSITPPDGAARFVEALQAAKVPSRIEILDGLGHGIAFEDFDGCVNLTRTFLDEHLGLDEGSVSRYG